MLLGWLGYRAIRRRKIVGPGSGEVGPGKAEYYLLVAGYLVAGLLLLLLAASQFHRLYGRWGVVLYVLAFVAGWWTIRYARGTFRAIMESLRDRRQRRRARREVVASDPAPADVPAAPATAPPPAADQPQDPAQRWVLAAAALMARAEGWNLRQLPGQGQRLARQLLKKDWDIADVHGFRDVQHWLYEEGHRHEFHEMIHRVAHFSSDQVREYLAEIACGAYGLDTPEEQEEERHRVAMIRENRRGIRYHSFMAWDYLRYIHLHLLGLAAGFISEAEMWQQLFQAGQVLQTRYPSWKQLSESFLLAREFWSVVEDRQHGDTYRQVQQQLLTDPQSPWLTTPWDLSLIRR
ncbi:MAG: hypothetical protein OHK0039_41550 [Bacteroidia bacterium]